MPATLRRSVWYAFMLLGACTSLAHAQQRPAVDTTLRAADAAWDAKELPKARALYQRIVSADSVASSRAVYRLGVLLSWDNQLPAAIRLLQLYVRLEPRDLEGRVGLARIYAWASRFGASVATYDTVIAREADYRDAVLGRAQALGWWGRLDESLAAYRAWRARHPDDIEAALAQAKTLAWKNALAEAEALYDSLGAKGGAEAEKGTARVQAWRGDLGRSEATWGRLAARYPQDPEVWTGLAQVQRWRGRHFAARVSLDQALRVRPGYDDARQQMRWVRAEISPQLSTSLLRADDSEKNLLVSERVGVDVSRAWGGRWSLNAEHKSAGRGIVATANAVRGALLWQPAQRYLTVRGELGVAALDGGSASSRARNVLTGGVRVSNTFGGRTNAGIGVQRSPFDEVASTIAKGLVFNSLDADVSMQVATPLTLAVAAGAGRAVGDLDGNRARTSALARARYTVRRGVALSLTGRTFGWNHPAFGLFFAPQRFTLMELGAEWERVRDLGLVLRGEAGLGAQGVRFENDVASHRTVPRGALTTGWRFAPGREIIATFTFANVANTATLREGEYRYSAISLGGRYSY